MTTKMMAFRSDDEFLLRDGWFALGDRVVWTSSNREKRGVIVALVAIRNDAAGAQLYWKWLSGEELRVAERSGFRGLGFQSARVGRYVVRVDCSSRSGRVYKPVYYYPYFGVLRRED